MFSLHNAPCYLKCIFLSQTILERGNDILICGEKGAWCGAKRLGTTALESDKHHRDGYREEIISTGVNFGEITRTHPQYTTWGIPVDKSPINVQHLFCFMWWRNMRIAVIGSIMFGGRASPNSMDSLQGMFQNVIDALTLAGTGCNNLHQAAVCYS